MRRSALPLLLLLVACPKKDVGPAPDEASLAELPPVHIEDATVVPGSMGRRVTLVGTLERRAPEGVDDEGVALVLAGGAAVFVAEGDPPESWEWLLDTKVRIQGLLKPVTPSGHAVPWLEGAESPMPAEADMPAIGFGD